MPSKGFSAPSILFLNSWSQADRAYGERLLRAIAVAGYSRYVEPCVGAFANTMASRAGGWLPSVMETSDVSLYSAVVGYLLSGQDHRSLNVMLDGKVVDLPDDPLEAAVKLLITQLGTRLERQSQKNTGGSLYTRELLTDLNTRRDEHHDDIAGRLKAQREALGGLGFTPRDIWKHLDMVADDPKVVVLANPPSYMKGYEKFFDTGDRLTWDAPEYDIWNPDVDFARLDERMVDAKALLLYVIQTPQDGGPIPHDQPVYAQSMGQGRYAYWVSNRPEEIWSLIGKRVVPREIKYQRPLIADPLPQTHEITEKSTIQMVKVMPDVAGYYKDLWLHRIKTNDATYNVALLIDGYVAGVFGYAFDLMRGGATGALLLQYGVAPWHQKHKGRLGRLTTIAGLQKAVYQFATNDFVAAATTRILTAEWTPYPESKGMRGLMTLIDKKPHKDAGWRLVYEGKPGTLTLDEVLTEWLTSETRYWRQKARSSS